MTVENVGDYFTIENICTTTQRDISGRYGRAIFGNVVAKQSVTMAGMKEEMASVIPSVLCYIF